MRIRLSSCLKMLAALVLSVVVGLAAAAVNINTASAEELKTLPGIGPAKAKAIVEYRTQNGAFKAPEDLKKVKGIGDGVFNKLKAQVVVERVEVKKVDRPAVKK